jgi:spermidine synthase
VSPRAGLATRRTIDRSPDWPLRLSVVLFALSGFAALIYEIVWFQMLELVVGSSAISLGILLGVFMGGMCAGSLLLPRLIKTTAHPFRVYALLELGIGVLAILVLVEVPLVRHLYMGSGSHGIWGIVLRAAIAGLCLLPPTILMGAALPAISRWVEASPNGVGWLGRLYASNTSGAIAGCLVAGFYLLRVYDMATATYVAAATNGLVALASYLLVGTRSQPLSSVSAETEPVSRARMPWLIYIAIGFSGLSALGGEVVWTRLLSLLLGGTVYTFSIILAVFLLGLGIGSGVGASFSRTTRNPQRDLGTCQVLLAAAIAWAAFMVGRSLPYWPIAPALADNPWIVFQLDIVRCLWAVLPAAMLWGASFPFALAAGAAQGRDPGRLVASIYASNTVGAIIGALVFTFIIVPRWGTHAAEQVLIALSAVAGLTVLVPMVWPPNRTPRHALSAVLLVIVAGLAWQLVRIAPPPTGSGGLRAILGVPAGGPGSTDQRTRGLAQASLRR